MLKSTLEERAAFQTAKEQYKEFIKKHPKKAEEEKHLLLTQIIDSEIPHWGSLKLTVSKKLF